VDRDQKRCRTECCGQPLARDSSYQTGASNHALRTYRHFSKHDLEAIVAFEALAKSHSTLATSETSLAARLQNTEDEKTPAANAA
jgi:hypothetical protein